MQAVDMHLQPYLVRETEQAERPQDVKKATAEPARNGDSFLAMLKKLIAGSTDGDTEDFNVEIQSKNLQKEAGMQDLSELSEIQKDDKTDDIKNTDLIRQKKETKVLNKANKPETPEEKIEKKADTFSFKENFKEAENLKIDFAEEVDIKNFMPTEIDDSENAVLFSDSVLKEIEKKEKKSDYKNQDNLLGLNLTSPIKKSENKNITKKSFDVTVEEKEIKPKKSSSKHAKPVITVEDLRLKNNIQADASIHKAGTETRVETDNTTDMVIDFRGKMQNNGFSGVKDTSQFSGESQKASQTFSAMLAQEIRDSAADFVQAGKIVLRDNNAGEIRLQLKPEHLGNVKIHLKLEDGKKVNGLVTVSTKEAYEAFEENLENLSNEFIENGFEFAEFNLNLSDFSSGKNYAQDFSFESNLFAENEKQGLRQSEKNADKLNVYSYVYGSTVDVLA